MKYLKIIAPMLCSMLWAASIHASQRDLTVTASSAEVQKHAAPAMSRTGMQQDEADAVGNRKEQDAWEVAAKSGGVDSYRDYLKGWPTGKYARLAQARIWKLQTDAVARQELEMWQKAGAGESSQSVQEYLDKYPKGSHVAAAREKLTAIRKAEAETKPGKVFRDCPDCAEMVVIPAGSFEMGGNMYNDEKPVHPVTIGRIFAMGKTEVTQGQWRAVMDNNPSQFASCGDNCPVDSVSWNDVQEFIQKLNAKTGKQYRLPSEAEWEYACRAGGRQEYCGSDTPDSVAWYGFYATPKGNSDMTTNRVATKKANAWGLYDMSGNVMEWVEDSYHDTYNEAPTDGSAWSGNSTMHVLRGGSWIFTPRTVRTALRGRDDPTTRNRFIGFRLASTLP